MRITLYIWYHESVHVMILATESLHGALYWLRPSATLIMHKSDTKGIYRYRTVTAPIALQTMGIRHFLYYAGNTIANLDGG